MTTGIIPFRTALMDASGNPITVSNPLPVTGGSAVNGYSLNDFEDGTTLYVGKVKPDGKWLVQRFVGGAMRYANLSNNPAVSTESSAWSGRTVLTYDLFQSTTDV